MGLDSTLGLEGNFFEVVKRTQEREEEVKRTVNGTGSLSLMKLKVLTENLCERDDDLKNTIKYMKNLISASLAKMEKLRGIVEKDSNKDETLLYINKLISEIKHLKENTHGK